MHGFEFCMVSVMHGFEFYLGLSCALFTCARQRRLMTVQIGVNIIALGGLSNGIILREIETKI